MIFASLLLNVDRIEIQKERDSIHYGSDALAGVIKIWTKPGGKGRGDKNWNSILRGEGGSFKSYGMQAKREDRYRQPIISIWQANFIIPGDFRPPVLTIQE